MFSVSHQVCRLFLMPVLDCIYQRLGLYVAPSVANVFLPLTLLYCKTVFWPPLWPRTKVSVSPSGSTCNCCRQLESVSTAAYVCTLSSFSTTVLTFFYTSLTVSVSSSEPALSMKLLSQGCRHSSLLASYPVSRLAAWSFSRRLNSEIHDLLHKYSFTQRV